jgi:diaminopimelate epimerase
MKLSFSKMHGAGNDFIVAENTDGRWPADSDFIRNICDRRRGVGADGLLLLSNDGGDCDVVMRFFNCDGSEADMCGNALRCAGIFAYRNIVQKKELTFKTGAGNLEAKIIDDNSVQIGIPVLEQFKEFSIDGRKVYKGNTGVPHAVLFLDECEMRELDIDSEGAAIRNNGLFAPEGANANFVCLPDNFSSPALIRTYERGVEGETQACGTGIAAAAVCSRNFAGRELVPSFITLHKDVLTVELIVKDNIVNGVRLLGPALEIFKGSLEI